MNLIPHLFQNNLITDENIEIKIKNTSYLHHYYFNFVPIWSKYRLFTLDSFSLNSIPFSVRNFSIST